MTGLFRFNRCRKYTSFSGTVTAGSVPEPEGTVLKTTSFRGGALADGPFAAAKRARKDRLHAASHPASCFLLSRIKGQIPPPRMSHSLGDAGHRPPMSHLIPGEVTDSPRKWTGNGFRTWVRLFMRTFTYVVSFRRQRILGRQVTYTRVRRSNHVQSTPNPFVFGKRTFPLTRKINRSVHLDLGTVP